ncbi:MAG: serine/threonine-protein kinase [Myxococcota bacterium]
MSQRETAAYPPRPSSAPRPAAAASVADTMMADRAGTGSVADTIGAATQLQGSSVSASSTPTLAPTTRPSVLPEVRSEGDGLVLVPRDKTRYEKLSTLGRGGMGEVKLASDHDIDRKVAIKRLLQPDNTHAVARFVDEVRTVGSLEHPNIVPIHDVGVDDDGALFFVMKYVEGETLASIIERLRDGDAEYHAKYTFERRLDLFAGLLRALQYAHSRGLVHRDVKPDNLMVGAYGEVILMDWGITHQVRGEHRPYGSGDATERAAGETMDGAVIGTPLYMSPEQAKGDVQSLDGRSDLYSAFVVLWELLTLRPYVTEGETGMETVLAALHRTLPSIADDAFDHPHQPSVAVELRHYLRHGLRHDKAERFGDAEEALFQLEQVRAGDFAVQCPVTFMKRNNTRMGRFMDRHPVGSLWLAGSTAAMFLFGLAGWVAFAAS